MSREPESMETDDNEIDKYFKRFTLGGPEFVYEMNHAKRGKFIIINNKSFHPDTTQNERLKTEEDVRSLCEILQQFGFDVTLAKDLTRTGMLRLMIQAGKEDHSNSDCFGVAVLSYSDDIGLCGTDDTIPISNFMDPIMRSERLNGKPKIFLFQACRGNQLDSEQQSGDGKQKTHGLDPNLPLKPDVLCAYSTLPGSCFIQTLTQALNEPDSNKMDFIRILTRVNYAVAHRLMSSALQPEIPSILSMLTKDLFLGPK